MSCPFLDVPRTEHMHVMEWEDYQKICYSSLIESFRFLKLFQGMIIILENFLSLDATPQQTLPVVKTIFQTSG